MNTTDFIFATTDLFETTKAEGLASDSENEVAIKLIKRIIFINEHRFI